MKSTNDVLDHHLEAIKQGDVNGVLSDYAPDAVLFRSDGVFKGLDAIRPVFEKFVAEFQKPGTTPQGLTMSPLEVTAISRRHAWRRIWVT